MLDDRELELLALDLESDRVERKSSLSDSRRVREAICAFANDLPGSGRTGVLLIGLKDDGACAGLPITDQLLRGLADMRSDGNILPVPSMSVQKRRVRACEIAVVEVEPALNPPVRFDGRVCVRVGPRRAVATLEEEMRLSERRRARDLPFDMQPVVGATLDELDLPRFQLEYLPKAVAAEVLRENGRPIDAQLTSLRLLTDGTPTAASLLLFGRDPLRWIPGAWVQFVRFEGTRVTDPIRNEKRVAGAMRELVLQLDAILDANVSVAVDVRSSDVERRRPDYPIAALQQATRNALMHRSYQGTHAPIRVYWFTDRVEIDSPGGLYGRVTPENFGDGVTDYRNPLVAEGLRVLGYVQRFGIGIPLIRQELAANGNPPPEFEFDAARVLMRMRR